MRHLVHTSEPPLDIVVGTQVCTTKPVTTAKSLRHQILRSREDERRARFLQLENAIRNKLLENKTRRKMANGVQEPEHTDESIEAPSSPNSELEKRVNLLTTFFYEMAVHQPRLDELHGSAAEAAEAVAEEELLKRFGDIFDRDENLHNALDEEKWSTETAKVMRRRDTISTNLPKIANTEGITATRDQIDEGVNIPWTFEDYKNTAQYIEQLMIDVATNETQQKELEDLAATERKQAVMMQLVASWQYTQHRISKAATRKRLNEIEQKRRNQWMQSQHVQVHGAVASAKRGDRPERPSFILPKQQFLVQEQSLPSTAIWEVPGSPSNPTALLLSGPIAATNLVSPARPMSSRAEESSDQSPTKLRPQRPPQRPATVTSSGRPSNITALRSAAIARARVRRIRSADSNSPGDPTSKRLQARRITSDLEQAEVQAVPPQLEQSNALNVTAPLISDARGENNNPKRDTPENEVKAVETIEVALASTVFEATTTLAAVDTKEASTQRSTTKAIARKRRPRKKRRAGSLTDARFRLRVLELVSISVSLQAAADEERKQAQGAVPLPQRTDFFDKH